MKIITLVENTSLSPDYGHRHGLSFYVETAAHKLLFDVGPDDLFLENAKKLGVDISAVDTVVISHGHRDHGGALPLFLRENSTAKVYVRENAFAAYCSTNQGITSPIGLDRSLMHHPQLVLTADSCGIDEELRLFSDVTARACYSHSNDALTVRTDSGLRSDDFSHEQNLIICENGKYTLFSGCAHNGVINILEKAQQLIGVEPDVLLSGFHLYNPKSMACESEELTREIAVRLQAYRTRCYTCHCTGATAFATLRSVLGDRIQSLAVGSILEL